MIYKVNAETINEMYQKMLRVIVENGEPVNPRGFATRELRPLIVRLENSLNNIITLKTRKLNYSFMVAEWLWMAWGRNDVEMISHYNKALTKFSDDGETFFGAYGVRIMSQLHYVIGTLKRDVDSRQAIISLWRPNPPSTKDVPCTSLMQFMIRKNKLESIVTMRSSDVWLGIPYDVFNFTRIQAGIAAELGISPGPITLQLGSSHIYMTDFEKAHEVMDESRTDGGDALSLSPELPCWPPKAMEQDEHAVRINHETVSQHSVEEPWVDYLEALGYRNHKNSDIGSGHMMEVIRYAKT